MRAAAIDFYFNSWRLVPANLVWSVLLLAVLFAALVWLPLLLLLVVLALPTAGMFRIAAKVTHQNYFVEGHEGPLDIFEFMKSCVILLVA